MIDLAYIQKNPETGEFISEASYTFWHGCNAIGIDTKSFTILDFDQLELRRETLVHGGIGRSRILRASYLYE